MHHDLRSFLPERAGLQNLKSGQNFPIYDKSQTQSAEVLALPCHAMRTGIHHTSERIVVTENFVGEQTLCEI